MGGGGNDGDGAGRGGRRGAGRGHGSRRRRTRAPASTAAQRRARPPRCPPSALAPPPLLGTWRLQSSAHSSTLPILLSMPQPTASPSSAQGWGGGQRQGEVSGELAGGSTPHSCSRRRRRRCDLVETPPPHTHTPHTRAHTLPPAPALTVCMPLNVHHQRGGVWRGRLPPLVGHRRLQALGLDVRIPINRRAAALARLQQPLQLEQRGGVRASPCCVQHQRGR